MGGLLLCQVERETDQTDMWIHQMKCHDNIRARPYYCKHIPYALTVPTSVSFLLSPCLTPSLLIYSFPPSSPPSFLHTYCFIEECSTEANIWSHCCFDLKMEEAMEGGRGGGVIAAYVPNYSAKKGRVIHCCTQRLVDWRRLIKARGR